MSTFSAAPQSPARFSFSQVAVLVSDFRWPLLILVAHLPLLTLHFRNLWQRPQYQYFPLVLATVGWLLWTRAEPLPRPAAVNRLPVYALLATSLLLLCFGSFAILSPWLGAVAFILACGATMLLVRQRYFVRNLFGIWVLLWLLVPLPVNYDQKLSLFLQRATTKLSGRVLELIGIPNLVEGTTLALPGRQLFVEEACSGIVSMMAIVAACLIVAVWSNRGWIHAVLLVLSGLALAAVTNVLRIVTLGVAQVNFGIDLTSGWKHELLGVALFLIAILLAFSMDRLLHFLLAPISSVGEGDDEPNLALTRLWNLFAEFGWPKVDSPSSDPITGDEPQSRPCCRGAWIATWACVFTLASMSGVYAIATLDLDGYRLSSSALAETLSAESLPRQVEGWQRVGFGGERVERLFAQESRIWTYQRGSVQAIFSCDFPFDRWHDLRGCYDAVGWERVPTEVPAVCQPATTDQAVFVRCEYSKGSTEYGMLMFCLVDHLGAPADPPDTVSAMENLRRRLRKGHDKLYQIQLWVVADHPLDAAEQASAQQLFESLRGEMVALIPGETGARDDGGQQ